MKSIPYGVVNPPIRSVVSPRVATSRRSFRRIAGFSSGALLVLGLFASARAATINVNSNSSLSSALSAANPGDTIVMANGNYSGFTVSRSGTASSPIVIQAANQGGAVITSGVVHLAKTSYVTVQGLKLTTSGSTVTVDGESYPLGCWLEVAKHCRVTRCTFKMSGVATGTEWLMLSGASDSNRVDHNEFGPNTVKGCHFVWPRGQRSIPGVTPPSDRTSWANGNGPVNPNIAINTQIDHNYFHDQASGTAETVVTGALGVTGDYQNTHTLIENNLFVNCDGDPEIISVKSSSNIVRYNTIRTSAGMISLRSGNNSQVYGNIMLQGGKSGSGGIKFFEKDHVVYNNYIDHADQYPILIGTGDSYTSSSFTHAQVFRAKVLNNTVVNISNTPVSFGFGNHSLGAVDTVFANNIVAGTAKPIFQELVKPTNVTYSSNIAWPTSGGTLGTTTPFTVVDPKLAASGELLKLTSSSPAIDAGNATLASFITDDVEGQPRSTIDIGADEFSSAAIVRTALTTADVGPNGPPDNTGPSPVANPVITPGTGSYSTTQSVTLTSATSGASFRYTTDGSTPSSTVGTLYSGPITVSTSLTLRAIAFESGLPDSQVVSATYTIGSVTPPSTITVEAESLSYTPSGATATLQNDTNTSGGHWLSLDGNSVGDFIDFTLPNVPAGTYAVALSYKTNNNRGTLSLKVDGIQVGSTVDQYGTPSTYPNHTFGTITFASAGTHTIRLTVTGKNSASSSYVLSADQFILTP